MARSAQSYMSATGDRAMIRAMLRSLALSALCLAACSKSAANQDTGSNTTTTGGPKKIAVPTDEGMPPPGGGMMPGSGATEMKGGGEDRFKLKPDEGKLAIDVPADAKAGAETVAKVTVTPAGGFHVNAEYPTKLTLTAPSGVTLAKAELVAGGMDKQKGDADQIDDNALIMSVKATAAQPGTYTINGVFKFAVCKADQCLAKKETIALQIAAK